MIKLYDRDTVLGNMFIVRKPSLYFRTLPYPAEFDSETDELLADVASVLKRDGPIIVTPYGATTLENLPSGVKTALLVKNFVRHAVYDKVVSLHSCGSNALKYVFKWANDTDVKLLLGHYTFDKDMPDYEYDLNDGEYVGTGNEALFRYWFWKVSGEIDEEMR